MRLPAEKIKEAFLSKDRELREAAAKYFSGAISDDPTLMPLAIAAIDRYGLAAFDEYSFLVDLLKSETSVVWLCRQIEELHLDPDDEDESADLGDDFDELDDLGDDGDETDDLADDGYDDVDDAAADELWSCCREALCCADAAVLKPHAAMIADLQILDTDAKDRVAHRIRKGEFSPEALWNELTDLAEELDRRGEFGADCDEEEFGFSVADALARYPQECAQRVLELLNQDDESHFWSVCYAVRIAARLRLHEAIPRLVELSDQWDSRLGEEAAAALVRIGSDEIVDMLAARFDQADELVRMTIAILLKSIHSDRSVEVCLTLRKRVDSAETHSLFIQAVLGNFSTEGIELARQFVSSAPKPEMFDVRRKLLTTSKMLQIDFPEFEQWTADQKSDAPAIFDAEWRRAERKYDGERFGGFESDHDLDDGPDDGLDIDLSQAATFVRQERRVGRNEPCPCGSGKKYKKCCYQKDLQKANEGEKDERFEP